MVKTVLPVGLVSHTQFIHVFGVADLIEFRCCQPAFPGLIPFVVSGLTNGFLLCVVFELHSGNVAEWLCVVVLYQVMRAQVSWWLYVAQSAVAQHQ